MLLKPPRYATVRPHKDLSKLPNDPSRYQIFKNVAVISINTILVCVKLQIYERGISDHRKSHTLPTRDHFFKEGYALK